MFHLVFLAFFTAPVLSKYLIGQSARALVGSSRFQSIMPSQWLVKDLLYSLSPCRDSIAFGKPSPQLSCLENVLREKYGQLTYHGFFL